ncbi:metallophosphoesterase family protein [Rhizobium laguerreae]|uniref:metallophosphoesterase family protein n=1 Tax=Rhizobium laguerreae TaxID=1076926 RepID=UPI002FFE18F7
MSSKHIHTFAIGDVHGRADLLKALLDEIDKKASRLVSTYRVVFLGDIIDRGPDSRKAMDLVARTLAEVPGSRLILGNHDSYALRIIDETNPFRKQALLLHWISQMGGAATLASYGFKFKEATLDVVAEVIDGEHIDMLRAAQHYFELEYHILVHAGLEPGIPLQSQDPYKLMWIREPFLSYAETFGKTVVHGHTPVDTMWVQRFPNRIAIDTDAHVSGTLSALHVHPSGRVEVIQAQSVAGLIAVSHGEPMQTSQRKYPVSA